MLNSSKEAMGKRVIPYKLEAKEYTPEDFVPEVNEEPKGVSRIITI